MKGNEWAWVGPWYGVLVVMIHCNRLIMAGSKASRRRYTVGIATIRIGSIEGNIRKEVKGKVVKVRKKEKTFCGTGRGRYSSHSPVTKTHWPHFNNGSLYTHS